LLRLLLLVAQTILPATIRTIPGNPVAGHPPEIFIHAVLADAETAPALPVKMRVLTATMAVGFPAGLFLFPV
jgi:hypothetical protein